MNRLAILMALSLLARLGGAAVSGPAILFDTDIGPDCDDVGATAILNHLTDLGECRILGMAAVGSNAYLAPCLDAINTWYGRPDIPIGTLKESGYLAGTYYSNTIAQTFPNDLQNGANAPDAVALYRQILAAQPDGSVTMVATGPLRNMRSLLRSVGDGNSALSGHDLVAAKVANLVLMAGLFPSGKEWNVYSDAPSAQVVVDEWPTSIVFSGYDVGFTVLTGHTLTGTVPVGNPVRKAYELYVGANNDRSSWDPTAMLYAIRGSNSGLFGLSATGTVSVAADGTSTFTAGAGGKHHYITKLATDAQIAAAIEALYTAAPMYALPAGTPPTVANAAAGPAGAVTTTNTAVSVLGASGSGENTLTYTWSAVGPGPVTFTPNGTNAAKNAAVTFTRAGSYTLTVTVAGAGGLHTTSIVTVTVAQALTAIAVTPAAPTMAPSATQQFAATGKDQFAVAMDAQPTIAWSATGSGSISGTGLFTAAAPAGTATVTASGGGKSGTATVSVGAASGSGKCGGGGLFALAGLLALAAMRWLVLGRRE